MAIKYKELSIAEQNSIDLAWQILMEDQFKDLRSLIYTNADEFKRFRQILVNIVLGKCPTVRFLRRRCVHGRPKL
jgi:hypothetical protein